MDNKDLFNDPARAFNRTREEIRIRGAVFNINEGIDIQDSKNCTTRLVGWPGMGTRMVSFHLLIHKPGGGYDIHYHPMSVESLICVRGKGEINLGSGWVTIAAGNAIYVPAGRPHATRNTAESQEDFIVLSYNCPPPMEYYQKIGLFVNGDFDWRAIDSMLLRVQRDNIPEECVMSLNDFGGNERGEVKGPEEVSHSGGIFNVYRGAPFTGNGGLMKFVLWPGAGCTMVGQHTAYHEPGKAFIPHIHPISEDAIFCFDGKGMGYLESRWIKVREGDIVYAPALIKHGTGCHISQTKTFLTSGCATPPQYDLYEKAGYLKEGKFVDFPVI
ncbi:MAG: hypothetical protein PWQ18_1393 [Clostridia bacterium]|nr:hypothetical protein [Clostridia bacterium]